MAYEIDTLALPPATLGEGILWCDQSQSLWWVDIRGPHLHRHWPATGRVARWTMPSVIGCLALCDGDRVIVALHDGLHRFDPADASLIHLTALTDEPDYNRPNDGAVSRAGRFYVGTMHDTDRSRATGQLHSFDGSATRRHLDGLFLTNGLAFSPDDATAYMSDSIPHLRCIWAFDHDTADGTLSNRRLFFDTHVTAGRPDGACIDSDGCYWMAGVGGGEILRLTPRGEIDQRIAVPVERPSKPCFGGSDLRTLFVTSIGMDTPDDTPDGRVLAIRTPFQGVPEGRCRLPSGT